MTAARKSLSGFPFFDGRGPQFRHATALAHRFGTDFRAALAETDDPRVAACTASVAGGHSDEARDTFRAVPND